jgi:MYXO-CTERM domain-containing protein
MGARFQRRTRVLLGATGVALGAATSAHAQTKKTFIDYLRPTPVTCSPLSSATWGVAGVLPRDICNGIESAKGVGVPPDYYYWDGKIIRAGDGKYHLFMSTWAGSAGFNPGWTGSESYHAVSSGGVLGPYERQDYVFSNNGSHHGHNTSACELPGGGYAVVVSEVVPFTIYQSSSLDGPWTACPNPSGELIRTNGVNAGSDTHWDSNVSLTPREDGKFEIVQRHGLIALADSLCGPYLMQKPTWTYPKANLPSIDSIYPHRTSQPDPEITNPTYDWEEDPTIWYSGGRYHVLYQSSTDRVGYELSSPDGVHDWTDGGLAYDPRMYQKIFGYEDSSTYTKWYKMERPGVVLEDGHVTHVTWAVADVDKDNQIPAGSNHGSKIIVVPFDGVGFDAGGAAGAGGNGAGGMNAGTGGAGAAGGLGGVGGAAGAGRSGGGANSGGNGGVNARGGSGEAPAGGVAGVAGAAAAGAWGGGAGASSTPGGAGTRAAAGMSGATALGSGGAGAGGVSGSGASAATTGGAPSTAGAPARSTGCGCAVAETQTGRGVRGAFVLAFGLLAARRRRGRC